MNEEHVIAAILAAGLIARNKDVTIAPKDAVNIYGLCLAELIEANRGPRDVATNS